jgi:hypothetical protein
MTTADLLPWLAADDRREWLMRRLSAKRPFPCRCELRRLDKSRLIVTDIEQYRCRVLSHDVIVRYRATCQVCGVTRRFSERDKQ